MEVASQEIGSCKTSNLFFGLVLIEVILLAVFVADSLLDQPIGTIHILFDLDGEGNIPAWFSSIQLFLIGLVLFLKGRQSSSGSRPSVWFFFTVSTGFVFLSMDETAAIHEKITEVLKPIAWVPRFAGDHGIWIFVYSLIAIFLALVFFRDLIAIWRQHRRVCSILLSGMAVFAIGVVGLEIMSYYFLRSGNTPVLYQIEVALEEFLEMLGESIMLYGALVWAREESGPSSS